MDHHGGAKLHDVRGDRWRIAGGGRNGRTGRRRGVSPFRPMLRSRSHRFPVELADRQAFEEFIGDEEQRRFGRSSTRRSRAAALQGPRLQPAGVGDCLTSTTPPPHETPAPPGGARMSEIIVPRPGPSSARVKGVGDPCPASFAHRHSHSNSPNIWLISGRCGEIACRAKGVAGGVVAKLGNAAGSRPYTRRPSWARGSDPADQQIRQRGHCPLDRTETQPTASIGKDKACPCVSPQPPICRRGRWDCLGHELRIGLRKNSTKNARPP